MVNRIIIRDKKDNYFFKNICNNYNIYEMYGIKTGQKLYSKLSRRGIYIFGDWKKNIKKCNEIIIFESLYNEKIAKYIKKKNPNCRIILFFWNIIVDETRKRYLKDSMIDEFWTFDSGDAKKYKMNINSQFYTNKIKLNEREKEIDVIFLGRDKGRKEEILKLEEKLKENNVNTDITIIPEKSKKYIKYSTYLENVEKSKVILDFVIEGQRGLTLRCMESLFFERKLITNNKEIKKYEFYNPNNIFILGEDNFKRINEFVNTEYEAVDSKIVEYYDIENWLKRFDKIEKD